jgi:hypothetical protein
MTSFRQIEANRRNALKSTGPNTSEGKERSRCNAIRHGLTAETVIGALEDAEDYKAFEAAIISDYNAESAVERELILRLASLLWRLRRATTMETGLLQIQADNLHELRQARQIHPDTQQILNCVLARRRTAAFDRDGASQPLATADESAPIESAIAFGSPEAVDPTTEIARCFLRLANLPSSVLERLSRYEAALWRQVGQILFTLDALDRRKPRERRYGMHSGRDRRLSAEEREQF